MFYSTMLSQVMLQPNTFRWSLTNGIYHQMSGEAKTHRTEWLQTVWTVQEHRKCIYNWKKTYIFTKGDSFFSQTPKKERDEGKIDCCNSKTNLELNPKNVDLHKKLYPKIGHTWQTSLLYNIFTKHSLKPIVRMCSCNLFLALPVVKLQNMDCIITKLVKAMHCCLIAFISVILSMHNQNIPWCSCHLILRSNPSLKYIKALI